MLVGSDCSDPKIGREGIRERERESARTTATERERKTRKKERNKERVGFHLCCDFRSCKQMIAAAFIPLCSKTAPKSCNLCPTKEHLSRSGSGNREVEKGFWTSQLVRLKEH